VHEYVDMSLGMSYNAHMLGHIFSTCSFNWIHDSMHLFVMYLAAFCIASPPAIKALGGNSSNGEYLIGLGEHSQT
jgi:hypothetical protein